MPNPVFNEESFSKASQDYRSTQAGWAAPEAGTHVQTRPISDGPISGWQKAMTINGTITASAVLLVLLLVSASFGWAAATGPVTNEGVETYQFPAIAMIGGSTGTGRFPNPPTWKPPATGNAARRWRHKKTGDRPSFSITRKTWSVPDFPVVTVRDAHPTRLSPLA